MSIDATSGDEQGRRLPCLDFGAQLLTFPERGHHGFVSSADLETLLPSTVGAEARGLWVFRAESGVCGIAGCRTTVLRDGLGFTGLTILHHGQRVEIDGKAGRFHEIRRMVLAADSRLIGRRCAYCKRELEAGEIVLRCPLCGASYGGDCWKELERRRCCSRNCHFSPAALAER